VIVHLYWERISRVSNTGKIVLSVTCRWLFFKNERSGFLYLTEVGGDLKQVPSPATNLGVEPGLQPAQFLLT
jgi:hypothetical protein